MEEKVMMSDCHSAAEPRALGVDAQSPSGRSSAEPVWCAATILNGDFNVFIDT
jgi:hypothetical protein